MQAIGNRECGADSLTIPMLDGPEGACYEERLL
jgi:hypothetical protein